MVKQYYYDNNNKVFFFVVRLCRFKADDDINVIKDNVYILPCLCYYFNSSEFYASFSWLNFTSSINHINYRKKRAY